MQRLKPNEFRVKGNITPLPYGKRVPIQLYANEKYYISHRSNIVCPCKLDHLYKDASGNQMACMEEINATGDEGSKHYLYVDEIGSTPEEAILYQGSIF